jgi:hypothetical protein
LVIDRPDLQATGNCLKQSVSFIKATLDQQEAAMCTAMNINSKSVIFGPQRLSDHTNRGLFLEKFEYGISRPG